MPRIAFDTFAVQAPLGWVDITADLVADDPPFTIAHQDGVGALQFSIALNQSGPVPDPTPADLLEMVKEFGRGRQLGEPTDAVRELGPPRLAAGSFAWDDDFLRLWQVSDGGDFAFVTYTCADEKAGLELVACEQIVRSITFASAGKADRSKIRK